MATIFSQSHPTYDECRTAEDPAAAAVGYWDLGNYSYCDNGIPKCQNGAKKVLMSATDLPDGGIKYHTACVLPKYLTNGNYSADEFDDGKTIMVYAHQDDDLLWMLPFWSYSRKMVYSALPSSPAFEELVSRLPPDYQRKWAAVWGSVTRAEYINTYLDKCKRKSIITFSAIKEKIRPYISDPSIKRIVTHNNWGEYGHLHHRMVNKAVRELAREYGKDVWVLSMKVDITPGSSYENTGDFGLSYIYGNFSHSDFVNIKRIYQSIFFDPDLLPGVDIWTWHDGEYEYPFGKRMYVKIVDKGEDLSVSNAGIQDLVDSVPVYGDCDQYACGNGTCERESGETQCDCPEDCPVGDLNNDGLVNIQDLQACVNHILGTQDWGDAADVNCDGAVNILDVQEIANIILGV